MHQRNLPVINENGTTIALIAEGGDIWNDDACDVLLSFCNIYLMEYYALPMNSQFIERGVKESGVISSEDGGGQTVVFSLYSKESWFQMH